MKLTKREQELTKAQEQGARDFENHGSMPDYGNDRGLEQAWNQGFQIARNDYISFYGAGYD